MYCQRQEFLTCVDQNNRIYQTPISYPQPCAANTTPALNQNASQPANYCQTSCNYYDCSTANCQQQQQQQYQQTGCGYVPSSVYPNLQYAANPSVYTVSQAQQQQQQQQQQTVKQPQSSQSANQKQAISKKRGFKNKNSNSDFSKNEDQNAKKKFSLRAISLKKKLCILFGCLCCILTIVLLGLIPVFLQLTKKSSSTQATTSLPSIITFIITASTTPASVNNNGF